MHASCQICDISSLTHQHAADCPLCMREVNMLQRRDAGKGKIDFVNIGAPDYDPAQNAGISYEQVCPLQWLLRVTMALTLD